MSAGVIFSAHGRTVFGNVSRSILTTASKSLAWRTATSQCLYHRVLLRRRRNISPTLPPRFVTAWTTIYKLFDVNAFVKLPDFVLFFFLLFIYSTFILLTFYWCLKLFLTRSYSNCKGTDGTIAIYFPLCSYRLRG